MQTNPATLDESYTAESYSPVSVPISDEMVGDKMRIVVSLLGHKREGKGKDANEHTNRTTRNDSDGISQVLVKSEMKVDGARFERSCGFWCACPDCMEQLEEEVWEYGI